jgi:hypothetical protein
MGKWLIVILAVVGALTLIGHYMPETWHAGPFAIKGTLIPWAGLIVAGVIWLGIKAK